MAVTYSLFSTSVIKNKKFSFTLLNSREINITETRRSFHLQYSFCKQQNQIKSNYTSLMYILEIHQMILWPIYVCMYGWTGRHLMKQSLCKHKKMDFKFFERLKVIQLPYFTLFRTPFCNNDFFRDLGGGPAKIYEKINKPV